MSVSDEAFREAFKPLHIPAHYTAGDSDEHKVIYALAQLGEASSGEVAKKLADADGAIDEGRFKIMASSVLNSLYDKGLIKGIPHEGIMHYNLSKITEANQGGINPDLLAPGLD